jgi:outer membrane receptor protein involved in Fe transport
LPPVNAQTPRSTPTPAQQIEIKGQGLRTGEQAYSRTTLDAPQIRDAAVNQPEALLRQVPGVELRSYGLGGVVNVVTVRGFNGGAHGGDLGMVVDGIPLNEAMSHSDGYADLNVIVPLEIERFQVYRGPVSALYGNFNRGGLVAIETRRRGNYLEADASLGSFSTADFQAALGTTLGGGDFNGAAQLYRSGDFRPDSKYTRGTVSGRWSLDLGGRGALSLSARAHQGDWDSASYLAKSQFDAGDPYGKDPRVRNDGGSKNFTTGRVDYNLPLVADLKLLSFAYGTQQDYTRYFTRPLNAGTWSQREETYDRRVAGAGASLNGRLRLDAMNLDWVAGAEFYRESTDYLFFEGTQARARMGPAVFDRRYDFNSASAFTELALNVAPWLRPTLGLRHDRFTGDCPRQGAETGTDPCARLNPASRTTPKLGLVSTLAPGLDLRGSIAEGFALPPGAAKYAAGGAGLKPTVFRQTELGAAYKSALVRADFASYRITSSNEVRTVSPGVFENFGRTLRRGTEAAFTLTPFDSLEIGLVATRMNARVEENANPALVGRQVTGVPRQTTGVTLAWRPQEGFGASAEWRRASDSAVDAANTVFIGGYSTVELGLHYVGRLGATRYRAYGRVQNAGDRVYASNAFVIGGQQLVAPAAPRAVQVGVQADF